MPKTLIRADLDLALDVLIDLASKVTFHAVLSPYPIADPNHFFVG
jgi:hypothetical protein